MKAHIKKQKHLYIKATEEFRYQNEVMRNVLNYLLKKWMVRMVFGKQLKKMGVSFK